MTPPAPAPLDLSGCDREPIRTPGSIQPHGFLLTLSSTGDVLQASANLAHWTGVDAQAATGQPLAQVIGVDAAARLLPALTGGALGDRPFYLGTITAGNGLHFDALGHAWDGVLILECEAVERA